MVLFNIRFIYGRLCSLKREADSHDPRGVLHSVSVPLALPLWCVFPASFPEQLQIIQKMVEKFNFSLSSHLPDQNH